MKYLRQILMFLLNPRPRYGSREDGFFHREPDAEDQPAAKDQPGDLADASAAHRHLRLGSILTNIPLMLGVVIVLGLFLIALFGPLWAPENPYIAGKHIVPFYDSASGEWVSPPLAPSGEYPLGTNEWGNDILSMLLYGARNTLVAGAFIAMVRIILGLILGAYAGWNEGSLADQVVMGAIGIILSIPTLISSMMLIFALDIRRGLPVFIASLAVLGWTEIAQYIRSEFIVLRKMPFIEGARAVGTPSFAIAIRHILPNLLPQILVITFLEMGAVLTLLGELAFIGVFIGGGSRIALGDEMTGIQVVAQSQVPEWGAMLAEGYRWLRAKPFIIFPPAMAFFIAVVGFNALGEGLRRLIEIYHVSTNFLLRKRMLLIIAGVTLATVFIINNTGPAPWFSKVARAFDGASAYEFTQTLASFEGRGAGQPGAQQAADFIAGKFEEYGLSPGWSHSSYLYPLKTRLVRPVSQPELVLLDSDGQAVQSYTHQVDFAFMTEGHGGSGTAEYPVTFVGFTDGTREIAWEDYQGLDLRGRIVLLWEGSTPPDFASEALIRGAGGILWVSSEPSGALRSQIQVQDDLGSSLVTPTLPVFRIRPRVAQAILDQHGIRRLESIQAQELLNGDIQGTQSGSGWFTQDLNVKVRMVLELEDAQEVELPCVLGYLPGSDYMLANEMVVLVAAYDGLGTDPDGTEFSGANHDASGVAVMLELARLWQQQDLNPRRMVLFVAWGAGSLEPAAKDQPTGLEEFLQDPRSFNALPANNTNRRRAPNTIIYLDNAGAGGEALYIHPGTTGTLINLLRDSASQAGYQIQGEQTGRDQQLLKVQGAATAYISWSQPAYDPIQDTLDGISPDKLQGLGEILSLALTTIVRESSY